MNLVNMGNKILFLCVSLLAYVNSYAKVVLPAYFTDNMVLQRDCPIHLWGWAEIAIKKCNGGRGMVLFWSV